MLPGWSNLGVFYEWGEKQIPISFGKCVKSIFFRDTQGLTIKR